MQAPASTCPPRYLAFPLRPAAKAVQVIAEVLAVLYAEAALLVQLQALLRANQFLAQYRWEGRRCGGRECALCGCAICNQPAQHLCNHWSGMHSSQACMHAASALMMNE